MNRLLAFAKEDRHLAAETAPMTGKRAEEHALTTRKSCLRRWHHALQNLLRSALIPKLIINRSLEELMIDLMH